jgi:PAS domain S-box-containing protein
VWLHVVSDALITLAYYSIPLTLLYIVRKRRDAPFRVMYFMFGGFIVACGTTHLMEIWNVWHGTYRLAGVVKAGTALLSVSTAVALVRLVPTALQLRSRKDMEEMNATLGREIAERKRSEAALEHERHLLRTLMDNLPDRIYFKDRESRFLRNNRAHLRRLGLDDPAQAAGKTDRDFFPVANAERALRHEQQVMSSGRTLTQEEHFVWPDGHEDWTLVTKMPLQDERGELIGTFGISRDVTDLKRSEAELRRAREGLELRVQQRTQELEDTNRALISEIAERHRADEELRRTLKELTDLKTALDEHAIVAITDPQGRITYANEKFCAISKYSRAELLGQDHQIINSRHHPKDFMRDMWQTIGRGQVWKGEIRNRAKDGSFYWVQSTIMPFLDAHGKPYQYVAIRTDITERKNAEAALEESLAEKETLLKETHHRVKNNLQLISSLLQLQAGYIEDPGALAVFRDGQNRIRSMALIHEKLYQSSSLARIDMAEYIRSLTNMLVHTHHTRTSKVSLHLQVQAVSLNLDTAIPLGLMLNELLSNCLEHAFPDHRAGAIRVSLQRAGDGQLALTVADTGVGLPEQLDWERTPTLGLRLIRILTEQLHGSLEIQRQPGTTVTLSAYELNKTRERN